MEEDGISVTIRAMNTYAFIDSQNLKKSVEAIGKEIDYKRFRLWLENKKGVNRAFMYFGYIGGNRDHYDHLTRCGFEMVFREVEFKDGRTKANVDICLTISMMDKMEEFDSAFLVSSDGDFFDLTERLKQMGKLGGVISPSGQSQCSRLLKKGCVGKVDYIPELIHKFEVRKK